MRYSFKWGITILLLFLCLSFISYIWINKAPKAQSIESIQVLESSRTLCFLPQYIAIEKGYFKEQNLDVELKTTPSKESITKALNNQSHAFILCSFESAINYSTNTTSPVAIAALTAKEDSLLLARKIQNRFTWQNVKSKSIIVSGPDSMESMTLESILRKNDIGPNYEVNIIQNIPDYLKRGVFKSGSASFIVLNEPEASMLEADGKGKIVTSLGRESGEIPASVIVCDRQFLKSHPELTQKYINAVYKAQLWMKYHNTQEAAAAVRNYFPDINQEILISSIDRYKSLKIWCPTPVISQSGYDRLLEIMNTSGELIKSQKYEQIVNTQFAQKAIKTVTYVPEEKKEKKFPLNIFSK